MGWFGLRRKAIDPVCGMKVVREEAAGTAHHEDMIYYFCSVECKTAFEEDPSKYV